MPGSSELGITYLAKLPEAIPSGSVLVHNHFRPAKRLGARGFRAWLSPPGEHLEVCDCTWAPDIGTHYRVRSGQVVVPAAGRVVKLYHRTRLRRDAVTILAEGFRDGEGAYLTVNRYTGVWLCNMPLNAADNEDLRGLLLSVEIPEAELVEHEWVEEGKPYREWLVPEAMVNRFGPPHLVEEDEEDDATMARFVPAPRGLEPGETEVPTR